MGGSKSGCRIRWELMGAAFSVTLVVSALGGCRQQAKSNETPPSTQSLNTAAVDFATFLIVDDLKAAASNENSMILLTSPEFLEWAEIDQRVTAKAYEAAYDANEIAADNAFKGKKLLVTGTLSGIEKDFSGSGFLDLAGTNPYLPGVHAQLADTSMVEAASMKKGQRLDIVCTGAGRVVTVALLNDCQPLSDYVKALTPAVKVKVHDALLGEVPLSETSAKMIAIMYVIGVALPDSSSCLKGDTDACKTALVAMAKEPTQKQSTREHFQRILSGIKIVK
jgi:hypothetical protein